MGQRVTSTKDSRTSRCLHIKKTEHRPYTFHQNGSLNSKWTIDLKCKAMKIPTNSIGENLGDIWYKDTFLIYTKDILHKLNNW